MSSRGNGEGLATQHGGIGAAHSQFTASQLDPTAHGADYGFLDFTQQDPGGDPSSAYPEFSAFSQVGMDFAKASVSRVFTLLAVTFTLQSTASCAASPLSQLVELSTARAHRMAVMTGQMAHHRQQLWCDFLAITSPLRGTAAHLSDCRRPQSCSCCVHMMSTATCAAQQHHAVAPRWVQRSWCSTETHWQVVLLHKRTKSLRSIKSAGDTENPI